MPDMVILSAQATRRERKSWRMGVNMCLCVRESAIEILEGLKAKADLYKYRFPLLA
jgi:hypothetical protein